MNYKELSYQLVDFLSYGNSHTENLTIDEIQETIQQLLDNYHELELNRENLIQRCQESQNQAHYLNTLMQKREIMAKYQHLISLKLQEKLLKIAQYLDELKSNRNYRKIPYLINQIIQIAPKVLPTDSEIFQYLRSTVEEIKLQMLAEFHSSFESHLVKSEELLSENNQKMNSWSEFLSSSRELIISYSMISILPSYFQDSNHLLCIEAYKECLDSAFTPLWGRFHFHLCTARDSNSNEQIIWTFEYSKSYISLLSELCGSITATSTISREEEKQKEESEQQETGLNKMLSTKLMNSFRFAAIEQIVEKSCRFLRSHVAECINSCLTTSSSSTTTSSSSSPSSFSSLESSSFLMTLLDCSLDLDSHYYSLLEETMKKCSSNDHSLPKSKVIYAIPVSLVFADHPICRNIWLLADSNHYKNALLDASHPSQYLSAIEDHDFLSLETDTSYERNYSFYFNSIHSSSLSSQSKRCYICLYECLYLFQLACQRYSFLNQSSSNLFILHIIEPILMTIIGFLWFYSKMNPTLRELSSRGVFPFHVKTSQQLEEYCGLVDTVAYIKEMFSQLEEYFQRFICFKRKIPNRFEKILKLFKQWMTEMTRGTKYQTLTQEDVILKIYIYYEQVKIKELEEEESGVGTAGEGGGGGTERGRGGGVGVGLGGEVSDLKPLIESVINQLDQLINDLKDKIKIAEKGTNVFLY